MKLPSRSIPFLFPALVVSVIGVAAIVVVLLVGFRARVVAQEQALVAGAGGIGRREQKKRVITEPCRLEKFDDATREVVQVVNWKAAATQNEIPIEGETIRIGIVLQATYGDFLQRYAKVLKQVAGPYTFEGSRGPSIATWIPVEALCEISMQPEVQRLEGPGGSPFPL